MIAHYLQPLYKTLSNFSKKDDIFKCKQVSSERFEVVSQPIGMKSYADALRGAIIGCEWIVR